MPATTTTSWPLQRGLSLRNPGIRGVLWAISGLGRWEGSPHAPGSVAIFELPVYRLEEIEAAFEDAAGDVRS
jgi:hypothetical protein